MIISVCVLISIGSAIYMNYLKHRRPRMNTVQVSPIPQGGVSIITVSHDGTRTISLNPETEPARKDAFDLPSYNEAAASPSSNELPPEYKIVKSVEADNE